MPIMGSARGAASWNSSPQGSGDVVKMHVLLPQAGTWLVVDLAKDAVVAGGFAAAAAGTKYIKVASIRAELEERLSMFQGGAEIVIQKCSADQPRGGELTDENSVYYLTWLIARTREAVTAADDWVRLEPRLKWNYHPPQDPSGSNVLQVLVYIEPTATWSEVWVPDYAAFTDAHAFSTVQDMKMIILAAFEPIVVDGLTMTFGVDDLEIKLCKGSHPDGDTLAGTRHLVNGKWYYVTANRLLEQLDQATQAADDLQ